VNRNRTLSIFRDNITGSVPAKKFSIIRQVKNEDQDRDKDNDSHPLKNNSISISEENES